MSNPQDNTGSNPQSIPDWFTQNAIYVGDLDDGVKEQELAKHFADNNHPIQNCKVCVNRLTGESLRYGYVNFASPVEAYNAFYNLNMSKIDNFQSRIRLSPAHKDPNMRKDSTLNLFIKNLPKKFGSLHLWKMFKSYGTISCVVPYKGRELLNYGYLAFPRSELAEKVKQEYDGKELQVGDQTYVLHVENYEPKSNRRSPFTTLFLGGVKFTLTSKQFLEETMGADITSVYTPELENKNFSSITFKDPEKAREFIKKVQDEKLVYYKDEFTSRNAAEAAVRKANPDADEAKLKEIFDQEISEIRAEKFTKRNDFLKMRAQDQIQNPDRAIYVKNFGHIENFGETELRNIFSDCGEIESVKIMRNEQTGETRGFGYVNFVTSEAAQKAIEKNGTDLEGKTLTVAEPKNKVERNNEKRLQMMQQQEQMMVQHNFMLQHQPIMYQQMTLDSRLNQDNFQHMDINDQAQYLGNFIYHQGINWRIPHEYLVQIISALMSENNINKMLALVKDQEELRKLLISQVTYLQSNMNA